MTSTQQAGVANTNAAAGMAQPYFNTATGFALAGSQAVNPSALDASAIQQYQNPYLQSVLGSTSALINQNNQQAQAGQLGNAITSGAFGGDRAGIAAATLAGQQQLAAGQTYSGIASDAYTQALQAAQQQQGVNLAAQQANRAALQQTGESIAGLGTGAQGAALQGAQAQLGAGQVGQQTQQAGLTALYNQFLQQQSYPFQVAQFLANIAEGTGALSGSTTTQTTPGGLFMSDERLKEDMEPIGKGFDGANIYRFRYKGDPTTRIGFSAQETERRHPEAVHNVGGFKAIEQHAATEEAAERGGFANAANDNADDEPRRARQAGGYQGFGGVPYPGGVVPFDVAALLQAQEQMYGPYSGAGLYGGQASGAPHGGSSYVPPATMPIAHLVSPQVAPSRSADPLHEAATVASDVKDVGTDVSDASNWLKEQSWAQHDPMAGLYARGGFARAHRDSGGFLGEIEQDLPQPMRAVAGGVGNLAHAIYGLSDGGRAHRQYGGGDNPADISNPADDDPYQPKGPSLDIPTEGSKVQQLQGPKISGQGGGDSTMGDIMDIAKIASMFAGANRGGRVPRAAGGAMDPTEDLISDLEGKSHDPIEDALLHQAMAPQPELEPPGPTGFAKAANASAAVPESAPGGPGPPSAPPAGFAGLKPPGVKSEAAPTGFGSASTSDFPTLKPEGTGLNKASGAFGVGQFLPSTFVGEFKQMFPERARGMSDDDIKALQHQPEGAQLQAQMIPHLRAENASTLRQHGLPVTPVTEHGMWILGPVEGPRVLSADPSTPMESLVRQKAIDENRGIMAGKTAGEFVSWLGRSINRAKGGVVRRGFQDAGLVTPDDPDAIDPSGGQDPDRRKLAAAPQVDPGIMQQAQLDDQVRAEAAKAAATPTPSGGQAPVTAAPAFMARAAEGFGDFAQRGFRPADQSQGAGAPAGVAPGAGQTDYLPLSEQEAAAAREHAYDVNAAQTQSKPGLGGWLSQPSHWMPLVSGVAGMLAAPTKYPLVAMSQGALAGANTYQQQRAYEMANAQKNAEIASMGENVQAGAYGRRSERMGVQNQSFLNALSYLQTRFTPVAQIGDDMMPGYTDNLTGKFVQAKDYARMSQAAMAGTLANFGGSGNPMVGAVAATLPGAPNAGGSGPNAVPNAPDSGGGPPSTGGAGPHAGAGGTGAGPQTGGTGTGDVAANAPNNQAAQPSQHVAAVPAHEPNPGSFGARVRAGEFRQPPVTQANIDSSGLTDATNPDKLYAQGMALQKLGHTPQQVQTGQQMVAQAMRYKNGDDLPVDAKTNQPFYGYRTAKQTSDRAAQVQSGWADDRHAMDQAAGEFSGQSVEQGQVLNHMIKVYQNWNTGNLSNEFAGLVSAVSSVPWLNQLLSPELKAYNDAIGEANKQTARQNFVMAAQSALGERAPASAMALTGRTVPDVAMGPGARYDLSAQQLALRNYNRAYFRDYSRYKGQVDDVQGFKTAWIEAHPLQPFEDQAYDAITPFAGMTHEEMMQHPRHPATMEQAHRYKSGIPYQLPGTTDRAHIYEN